MLQRLGCCRHRAQSVKAVVPPKPTSDIELGKNETAAHDEVQSADHEASFNEVFDDGSGFTPGENQVTDGGQGDLRNESNADVNIETDSDGKGDVQDAAVPDRGHQHAAEAELMTGAKVGVNDPPPLQETAVADDDHQAADPDQWPSGTGLLKVDDAGDIQPSIPPEKEQQTTDTRITSDTDLNDRTDRDRGRGDDRGDREERDGDRGSYREGRGYDRDRRQGRGREYDREYESRRGSDSRHDRSYDDSHRNYDSNRDRGYDDSRRDYDRGSRRDYDSRRDRDRDYDSRRDRDRDRRRSRSYRRR